MGFRFLFGSTEIVVVMNLIIESGSYKLEKFNHNLASCIVFLIGLFFPCRHPYYIKLHVTSLILLSLISCIIMSCWDINFNIYLR